MDEIRRFDAREAEVSRGTAPNWMSARLLEMLGRDSTTLGMRGSDESSGADLRKAKVEEEFCGEEIEDSVPA